MRAGRGAAAREVAGLVHVEAVLACAHALDIARDGNEAILAVLLEANRALDRAVDKGDCLRACKRLRFSGGERE